MGKRTIRKINTFIKQSNLPQFKFQTTRNLMMRQGVCCGLIFVSILMIFSISGLIAIDAEEILSPRKQMASGLAAENVVCKPGMTLMIRSTNGAAACVFQSTSMDLSEAGWGKIIKTMDKIETPIQKNESKETKGTSENSDGEVIEISIRDGVGTSER